MKFKLIIKDNKFVLRTYERSKFEFLCVYQNMSYELIYDVMVNDLINCITNLSQQQIDYLIENSQLVKYNVSRMNLYTPNLKNIQIDKRAHMNLKIILALEDALLRI